MQEHLKSQPFFEKMLYFCKICQVFVNAIFPKFCKYMYLRGYKLLAFSGIGDCRYFADGDTIRGDDIVDDDDDEECDTEEESEDESEDDDEEGWITPSNVDEMNKLMTGVVPGDVEELCTVGCLTTDFAMQVRG